MKKFVFLFSIFSIISTQVSAASAPFSWPKDYSFKLSVSQMDDKKFLFSGNYYVSGNNYRSDITPQKDGIKTEIVRLEENKKIIINKDGTVKEKSIPNDWTSSNFFPRNGEWVKIGNDTIKGKKAVKYEVSDAKFIVTMWLTPDNKTPLRMEDGDQIFEWSNYSTKPVDPKLFTVQTN